MNIVCQKGGGVLEFVDTKNQLADIFTKPLNKDSFYTIRRELGLLDASDYDYDDLDEVADEEDEDLIGDVSDAEINSEMDIDIPSDIDEEETDDAPIDDDDDDNIDIQVGDVDDASDADEEEVGKILSRSGALSFSW